jgi:hypothetical protein
MNDFYDLEELEINIFIDSHKRKAIERVLSVFEVSMYRVHESESIEIFTNEGQFFVEPDGCIHLDFFLGSEVDSHQRFVKDFSNFKTSYDVIEEIYKSDDGRIYTEDYIPRYYQIRDLIAKHLNFDDFKTLITEAVGIYGKNQSRLKI